MRTHYDEAGDRVPRCSVLGKLTVYNADQVQSGKKTVRRI